MISCISNSFLTATMALFKHSLINIVLFLSTVRYTLHITHKGTPNWGTFGDLDSHATSPPLLATIHPFCRCTGHYQTGQMTIKFPSQNIHLWKQAWQEKNSWTHKTKLQSVAFTMTQYNQSVMKANQYTRTTAPTSICIRWQQQHVGDALCSLHSLN